MESHGTSGRIQVTGATKELLGDDFVCEPRGTIPVKGKGEIEAWYLVRRRADATGQPGAKSEPIRPPEVVPGV
jgi:class 3 adenylate cyclase